MSLDVNTLTVAIQNAFTHETGNTMNQAGAISDLATKIADAVLVFIQGLEITYTSGLATTEGPVTGTFVYTLS